MDKFVLYHNFSGFHSWLAGSQAELAGSKCMVEENYSPCDNQKVERDKRILRTRIHPYRQKLILKEVK